VSHTGVFLARVLRRAAAAQPPAARAQARAGS
jgi:hypothetical protein